jgi:hypothetical protein
MKLTTFFFMVDGRKKKIIALNRSERVREPERASREIALRV